jgi:hypothetical protein
MGTKQVGWFPLRGSWEEAVLSWNEQIDLALRRQRVGLVLAGRKRKVPERNTTVSDVDEATTTTSAQE